jgi:rhodanese-related sulfurtransferase
MASFRADRLPTQDGKRIVFHCGSGMRSGKVARACAEAGLTPIAHMAGGFGAWKKAGLPYLAIDPATGGQKRTGG